MNGTPTLHVTIKFLSSNSNTTPVDVVFFFFIHIAFITNPTLTLMLHFHEWHSNTSWDDQTILLYAALSRHLAEQ